MKKTREIYRSIERDDGIALVSSKTLLDAIQADESAHKAELDELQSLLAVERTRVCDQDERLTRLRGNRDGALKRIEKLEAELAKRKELPPEIRESLESCRYPDGTVSRFNPHARAVLEWLDAAFPKPVPQWELDARYLESAAEALRYSAPKDVCSEHAAIAARIREAGRGKE